MISIFQTRGLAKKYHTNDANVFREYLQLLFLSKLYTKFTNKTVVFKGGTAIHLIFGAPRFSEDLDFTVTKPIEEFELEIQEVFALLSSQEDIHFKDRGSKIGKRYLLSAILPGSTTRSDINLDFSFRESVLQPESIILEPDYPVLFTSQIHHMSKNEILSEKVRAILNREKGRDLYDLWYLLSQRATPDMTMIVKKLLYYNQTFSTSKLIDKVKSFSKQEFTVDLRPFVAIPERDKLGELYDYIQSYLAQKLPSVL